MSEKMLNEIGFDEPEVTPQLGSRDSEPAKDFTPQSGPEFPGRPTPVYGSARNFAKYGLPSQGSQGQSVCYYFYPTWRSQLWNLILYAITCILTIVLSLKFPTIFVIKGPLFYGYDLALPWFVLVPGFILGKILITVYNSRYIIDETGVEAQVGLVSFYLRQPRLRYEDIRGVEPEQSLLERILHIGRVLIGSAMMAEVEIVMEGVPDPRAIQLLINKERDRHLQLARGGGAGRVDLLTSD